MSRLLPLLLALLVALVSAIPVAQASAAATAAAGAPRAVVASEDWDEEDPGDDWDDECLEDCGDEDWDPCADDDGWSDDELASEDEWGEDDEWWDDEDPGDEWSDDECADDDDSAEDLEGAEGAAPPHLSALRATPARRGAVHVRFRLDRGGTVTLALRRVTGARASGGVNVRGRVTVSGRSGANATTLRRWKGRLLQPGRYRLTATPMSGGRGATTSFTLRVAARRR